MAKVRTGFAYAGIAALVIVLGLIALVSAGPGAVVGAADPGFDPDVHVQMNSGGIDVSWVSAAEEDGFVEYALSAGDLAAQTGTYATANDDGGPLAARLNKRTHYVRVVGVPGASALHYNIVSGGVTTGPFQATLPSSALTSPARLLTGTVTYPDGSLGAECLVYARVTKVFIFFGQTVTEPSLWVNRPSGAGGGYVIDITNIRNDPTNALNNNFNSAFSYNPNSPDATITVVARCDPGQQGEIAVTTADAEKDVADNFINMDVVVGSTNEPPVANDDFYAVIPGQARVEPAPGVLGNDTDPDSPTLTAELVVDVPAGEGTLTLTSDGAFTYDPGNFVGNTSFTYRAMDDEGATSDPATVSLVMGPALSISDETVGEGDGMATLTVNIAPTSPNNVTVGFHTSNGTATAGQDYMPVAAGTVTIPAGASSATFNVSIIDDNEAEPVESFAITLMDPVNAVILDGTALVTIIDDDGVGPTCNGRPATMVGTNGNDTMIGTHGDDVIVGLGGDDLIRGLDGNDVICGGGGNDTILGGRGDDWANGGGHSDIMSGGSGYDTLYGGAGNDYVFGGLDDDVIYLGLGNDVGAGSMGDDLIYGGPGGDRLIGNEGDDLLFGQGRNDRFECGPGPDLAHGGRGSDTADPDCEVRIRVP